MKKSSIYREKGWYFQIFVSLMSELRYGLQVEAACLMFMGRDEKWHEALLHLKKCFLFIFDWEKITFYVVSYKWLYRNTSALSECTCSQ